MDCQFNKGSMATFRLEVERFTWKILDLRHEKLDFQNWASRTGIFIGAHIESVAVAVLILHGMLFTAWAWLQNHSQHNTTNWLQLALVLKFDIKIVNTSVCMLVDRSNVRSKKEITTTGTLVVYECWIWGGSKLLTPGEEEAVRQSKLHRTFLVWEWDSSNTTEDS